MALPAPRPTPTPTPPQPNNRVQRRYTSPSAAGAETCIRKGKLILGPPPPPPEGGDPGGPPGLPPAPRLGPPWTASESQMVAPHLRSPIAQPPPPRWPWSVRLSRVGVSEKLIWRSHVGETAHNAGAHTGNVNSLRKAKGTDHSFFTLSFFCQLSLFSRFESSNTVSGWILILICVYVLFTCSSSNHTLLLFLRSLLSLCIYWYTHIGCTHTLTHRLKQYRHALTRTHTNTRIQYTHTHTHIRTRTQTIIYTQSHIHSHTDTRTHKHSYTRTHLPTH